MTAGTNITNSGTVPVSEVTNLTATAGDITLGTAGNDFTRGGERLRHEHHAGRIRTSIDLGTVTAAGTLSVTAGTNITNSGTVLVSG